VIVMARLGDAWPHGTDKQHSSDDPRKRCGKGAEAGARSMISGHALLLIRARRSLHAGAGLLSIADMSARGIARQFANRRKLPCYPLRSNPMQEFASLRSNGSGSESGRERRQSQQWAGAAPISTLDAASPEEV
jgi:hypothetical protein